MYVVATAGHVDHGKSTLVRALTGMDPDRLAEERRRGLTIELGYCWSELPGAGDVAFVDVPGHEKFIATALSGVGPVPVALLVVAADDPWMPQAEEHLAALDALGVEHGLLVVTRSDLADPGPTLRAARERLDRTSLRDVPHVAVSAATGAGMAELRETLATVLRSVPAPDPAADVRLWVDRHFHVRGTGTVVTGTLPAGTISVGDTLEHERARLRVRAMESLGRTVDTVSGVARVALVLGGKVPESLGRGDPLTSPGRFAPTTLVDVRVSGDGHLPERPVLHIGAASLAVHARPLADGWLRIRLDRALPLRIGDRALLRDPGSRALWGVRVVDPAPPALRRRGAAARRAGELAVADGGLTNELERRGVVEATLLDRIGARPEPLLPGTVAAEGWLVSPAHAATLRARLADEVGSSDEGLTPEAAARRLALPHAGLVAPLLTAPLRLRNGRVVAGTASGLSDAQRRALERLRQEVGSCEVAAPEAGRLAELGLDPATIAALHRAGELLRLDTAVVVLPQAVEAALARLGELPQPFTVSEARKALGTTRRVVLPLLAHLDRSGVTVRLADDRRRLRTAASSSAPAARRPG